MFAFLANWCNRQCSTNIMVQRTVQSTWSFQLSERSSFEAVPSFWLFQLSDRTYQFGFPFTLVIPVISGQSSYTVLLMLHTVCSMLLSRISPITLAGTCGNFFSLFWPTNKVKRHLSLQSETTTKQLSPSRPHAFSLVPTFKQVLERYNSHCQKTRSLVERITRR